MWSDELRILLVEDDQDDYVITRDLLASQDRLRFVIDWCADYDDALEKIRAQRHDVYLIDYHLGAHTGLELVRNAFSSRPRAPVLILTGQGSHEIDPEGTRLGLTDFLDKGELPSQALERSIRYAVSHHRALNELSQSEERYALAVRAANDGLWDWDLTTDRIRLSPRWYAILGLGDQPGETTAAEWYAFVHPDDVAGLKAAIEGYLAGSTAQLQHEHRMRHADGSWRWTLSRGLAVRNVDGTPARMAGSLSDIDDRRATGQPLHDKLTGLPNRTLLVERMTRASQRMTRDPNVGWALLCLELDGLDAINAKVGRAAGDALLVALGVRVARGLRPGDPAARVRGRPLAVLLGGADALDDAATAAQRVRGCLEEPFEVGEHAVTVTASMGVAVADSATGPSETL